MPVGRRGSGTYWTARARPRPPGGSPGGRTSRRPKITDAFGRRRIHDRCVAHRSQTGVCSLFSPCARGAPTPSVLPVIFGRLQAALLVAMLGGPQTCVASQSSDDVPVLLALDVSIRSGGCAGVQELRLRDLFGFNRLDHLTIVAGALRGAAPTSLDIVIRAVNPQPRPIRGLDASLGQPLDGARIAAISDLVHPQTRAQTSAHAHPTGCTPRL